MIVVDWTKAGAWTGILVFLLAFWTTVVWLLVTKVPWPWA